MRMFLASGLLVSFGACASFSGKGNDTSEPTVTASAGPSNSAKQVDTTPGNAPVSNVNPEKALADARANWKEAELAKDSAGLWRKTFDSLALAAELHKGDAREVEIIRSALAAWQNLSRAERAHPRPKRQDSLSVSDRRAVGVLERLAALLPDQDPEQIRISYQIGQLHYRDGAFDKAIPIFVMLVDKAPAREEAAFAANLLLDSLSIQNNYQEMAVQVEKMLANKLLLDKRDELADTLVRIRHQGQRTAALAQVESGDFQSCGSAFMVLFSRDKKLDFVRGDELLHNASICFERAGDKSQAIKVLKQLVREYSKGPLAGRAKESASALAK